MMKRVLASTVLQLSLIFIGLIIVHILQLSWMYSVGATIVAICASRGIESSFEKRASRRHNALLARALSRLPSKDPKRSAANSLN
jgi:hypothetical protein